jgi:hypothetical protein
VTLVTGEVVSRNEPNPKHVLPFPFEIGWKLKSKSSRRWNISLDLAAPDGTINARQALKSSPFKSKVRCGLSRSAIGQLRQEHLTNAHKRPLINQFGDRAAAVFPLSTPKLKTVYAERPIPKGESKH